MLKCANGCVQAEGNAKTLLCEFAMIVSSMYKLLSETSDANLAEILIRLCVKTSRELQNEGVESLTAVNVFDLRQFLEKEGDVADGET